MSTDLGFGVSVAGVAEAVATLQRIGSAIGQTEQATRRQGQGARDAQAANDAFGGSLQSNVARVAGMANAVQSLSTRLGSRDNSAGLVGSVASTVAQFSSMGSVIGPGGAVLGAVVGLAASVRDLAAAHTEAAEAAAAQRQAEESLSGAGGIDTALRTGGDLSQYDDRARAVARQARLIRRQQAEQELAQAENEGSGLLGILNGPGSQIAHARAEQLRHDLEQIGLELRNLDNASAASGDSTGLAGLTGPNGPRLYGMPTTGDVASMTGLAEGTQQLRERAAAQERVRITAEQARDAEQAFLAEMIAASGHDAFSGVIDEQISDEAIARLAQGTQAEQEYQRTIQREAQATKNSQYALADAATTAQQAFSEGYVSSIDGVVNAYRRWQLAARAAGQEVNASGQLMQRGMTAVANNIADAVGGTMKGAFESALGAWLDGSKSFVQAAEDMAKGVLKALVTESIVQAVTETARGIADLASYHYDSAALHFAAAGAWAAVGVVAGGIGGAVGAFGGGGADKQVATTRDTASPSREAQQGGAGTNLTMYVYPGGYITQREVNAGILDALRQAAREGGQMPQQWRQA